VTDMMILCDNLHYQFSN